MSLIVYIFSVFFPCRRNSSALRVRSAGHALNLNKGCTKRQSLPNCQQNGRPSREYRPGKQDARCYFVRNGAATKVRRGGAFLRKDRPTEPDTASSSRRHAGRDSADTKAVIRTERQRKEARRGGVRGTGNRQQAAGDERWTAQRATDNRRRGDGRRWTAMDGGRKK